VKTLKTFYAANRVEWRAWLEKHHKTKTEVWLIYYKKDSGRLRIPYDDAVEEALCFGWVDSLVKRIDDEKFAQKFTPRKNQQKWSEHNKRRARAMIAQGKMTDAGLAVIGNGILDSDQHPAASKSPDRQRFDTVPDFVQKALNRNKKALEYFETLAPSHRRHYIGWITMAKRPETQQRRLAEAIELLSQNKKLGLK
jgi:uncharacterized protein YdeI (YjbR/CyaY-like superfamily)